METISFFVLSLFLAFGGLAISFYIYHKKKSSEVLVCPIGSSCDNVVHSDYSRFFGVPIEVIGIFYYGFLALYYGAFLAFENLISVELKFVFLLITAGSFLFSLYLTFIQGVVIREWCTWCLGSATITTFIFSIAIYLTDFNIIDLLAQYKEMAVFIHLIGFALGVGGATITDLFFFRFLKDFRISESESETMKVVSDVIWFGLGLAVLSGLALYLPEAEKLNHSAKFLTKIIAVGIIIINGAFLNLLISPRLVKISFHKKHEHQAGELHLLRRIAFAMGAISLTSWYSVAVLGFLNFSPLPFEEMLSLYISLLIVSVVGSQITERFFHYKAQKETPD